MRDKKIKAYSSNWLMSSRLIAVFKVLRRLFAEQVYVVKTVKGERVVISRKCVVCKHPQRAEIEKMLLEGHTYKEICERFGLDDSSLQRHFKNHMPRLIMDQEQIQKLYEEHRVKQIDLAEEMFKLIGRLEQLYQKLEKIDEKFFGGGGEEKRKVSPHAWIESIGERRQILQQIRETLLVIDQLKSELKTEKDLTELLQKLKQL